MTEDDAKKSICCGAPQTINGRDPLLFCLGSLCMAWRWHEPWTSSVQEGQGGDLVLRLSRKPGDPRHGYCGLAGPIPTP